MGREIGAGAVTAFDGNDYRKRVLAAVQRRGGPDSSDALELYDIALDDAERMSDANAAEQVGQVWAFWQRQRDHPKYGTLVTLLVETHEHRCVDVLHQPRRQALAGRVRAERAERDAARYELLDQAIARLVERYRGIPRDKLDGLTDIGALGGLSAAEVQARLRHHRVVEPVTAAAPKAAAPTISMQRRGQVRDLLDEFGRLNESPPPPTLLALLGLDPAASPQEIALRAESWRVRCRELPPLRIRAVTDELLVLVRDLLEAGRPTIEAYLDAVTTDVAEQLRPRVRAAVLVEDCLIADDHEYLLGEAQALGLDEARARNVLAGLAAEFGATVQAAPIRPAAEPRAPSQAGSSSWDEPLRAARAALRQGKLLEARRLIERARGMAGAEGTTPIRAVADEVADAYAEAQLRWRAASIALAGRRFAEAVEYLEYLCRTAVDVPGPPGLADAPTELDRARGEVADADRQVERAVAEPAAAAALLGILQTWPEHPSALAALAALPLHPPGPVTVTRGRNGSVLVSWAPSPTTGVTYRVSRRGHDGSWRVIGRTPATSVEDGGAPPGSAVPEYAVAAVRAGLSSENAGSGQEPEPAPPPTTAHTAAPAPSQTSAPTQVAARRTSGGSVLVSWAGPAGAEFKVSRQAGDGRWQVVGRTRSLSIEDGGASGTGAPPAYAVSAQLDGVTSSDGRTDA